MAAKITVNTLLEAGCHYGHQTRRWNPKMKPYIFGERNDIYILDLKQTILDADRAYTFLKNMSAKGGTILFVGTKKQAQESIFVQATRCKMPYVNQRWLGGVLTNFVTMRSRIDRMEDLEAMCEDGRMGVLPKKEQAVLGKELAKLQRNLGGLRDMKALPQALFVVDTKREEIAIREANRLGIPIVALLDTNSDPDVVEYGIPANDDAIRSIALMCELAADAILAGAGEEQISAEEMAAGADAAQGSSASVDAHESAAAAHTEAPAMPARTEAPTTSTHVEAPAAAMPAHTEAPATPAADTEHASATVENASIETSPSNSSEADTASHADAPAPSFGTETPEAE